MKKTLKLITFSTILLMLAGSFFSCGEKEEPLEPFLTVDETPISATTEAGTYSIIVSSNGEWTAVVENADWCTLTNNTGNGDGVITVSVAENTVYAPRSAKIRITSGSLEKLVTIKQRAAIFTETGDYPIEIPFVDFPVEVPCSWNNVTFPSFPVEDIELTIVNSEEEMRNSISCSDGNYPEIDFTEQTLFMTSGTPRSGFYKIDISLSKEAANEYVLNVIVRINGTWFGPPWYISIITPKIANEATVLFNVQEN